MDSPILLTKLFRPPVRAGLVSRPRLLERLRACLEFPLTLVSAPAGFGKSTLVGQYLQQAMETSQPVLLAAWLSLETDDDHPARFWMYLITALEKLTLKCVRFEQLRVLLESQKDPPIRSILANLINQLTLLDTEVVLVLDDFHSIRSLEILGELAFLIEHIPQKLHLILITRSDPSFPLGRWRTRGVLTEIRSADLRFRIEESVAYFNQAQSLPLNQQEIQELEERTEGWIAGLQMAALSLHGKNQMTASQLIAQFTGQHHLILDYLTGEVLDGQPKPVQDFLFKTAILDKFCPALCDAVLNHDPPAPDLRSAQIIRDLEQSNLFIIPLDSERVWYRYHHLFGELLRARLQERHPDWIPQLQSRASAWFESNGFPFEAMQHALATDMDLAADVIERAIRTPATWTAGNIARMLEAVHRLPEAAVAARPWMRVFVSSLYYVIGQLCPADQMLARLEAEMDHLPLATQEERLQLSVFVNAYRGFYAANRGDTEDALRRSQRTLSTVGEEEYGSIYAQALATQAAVALMAGNVSQANLLYRRAHNHQKQKNIHFTSIMWARNLADVLVLQGQLRAAAELCEETIQYGILANGPALTVGHIQAYLAAILYEWNRLEEAEELIYSGLRLLRKGGLNPNFGRTYASLALVQQALGKTTDAAASMDAAVRVAIEGQAQRYTDWVLACQARLWMAQETWRPAQAWAETYTAQPQAPYLREYEDLTLARVYLHQDRLDDGLALVEHWIQSAEKAGRIGPLIEALCVQALLMHKKNGDISLAGNRLAAALKLSEPEQHIRTYLDFGQPLQQLLGALSFQEAGMSAYRQRLLSGFRSPVSRSSGPEQTSLVEKLTERELEILRLVAAGLTNGQIAQKLYLTLNTVGAHTAHIFGKLGVHNRTEAAARARELGLL